MGPAQVSSSILSIYFLGSQHHKSGPRLLQIQFLLGYLLTDSAPGLQQEGDQCGAGGTIVCELCVYLGTKVKYGCSGYVPWCTDALGLLFSVVLFVLFPQFPLPSWGGSCDQLHSTDGDSRRQGHPPS